MSKSVEELVINFFLLAYVTIASMRSRVLAVATDISTNCPQNVSSFLNVAMRISKSLSNSLCKDLTELGWMLFNASTRDAVMLVSLLQEYLSELDDNEHLMHAVAHTGSSLILPLLLVIMRTGHGAFGENTQQEAMCQTAIQLLTRIEAVTLNQYMTPLCDFEPHSRLPPVIVSTMLANSSVDYQFSDLEDALKQRMYSFTHILPRSLEYFRDTTDKFTSFTLSYFICS